MSLYFIHIMKSVVVTALTTSSLPSCVASIYDELLHRFSFVSANTKTGDHLTCEPVMKVLASLNANNAAPRYSAGLDKRPS